MRYSGFKLCLAAALVAVLMGLAVLAGQAEARGGYGGGSFRGDGGVAVGPDGGVAVRAPGGRYVAVLPDGATRVSAGGQSYYVADGVYYQPCYVGADVNYCVVGAPVDVEDDGEDEGDNGDDDNDDGDGS
jgi:hypothetical protein